MARIGKKLRVLLKEPLKKTKVRIPLTSGQAIRIARELLNLTQNQLCKLTGLNQSTISSLENDRETLGVERAMVLARALKVHPAVLAFPSWDLQAGEPHREKNRKKAA